jgi:hypothetical protein
MKQRPSRWAKIVFRKTFILMGTKDIIPALRHVMDDLPTQREFVTAHERRARIIAQLHQQTIASATKAKIVKWLFVVGTALLSLVCFAAGWIVA